nr:hypothetical protein [Tanacetum cinerariifolium]
DHAAHWSSYIGEVIMGVPLYYPSWLKVSKARKASLNTYIETQFDLRPHMESPDWTEIDVGIQQQLQKAEVIEFGDSYQAPLEETSKGSTSESFAKKKGRTIALTTEDIQKRRNDVKARITLLLALPDEYQLRFSKYETAQEL